jgi:predicted nucleic acid-binding protein
VIERIVHLFGRTFNLGRAHFRSARDLSDLNLHSAPYGIAALPRGRRRTALLAAAEAVFDEDLDDRVLPFDGTSAARYAEIVIARNRASRRIEAFDALIAATALAAGAALATRDIGDFEGIGLALIDPWARI